MQAQHELPNTCGKTAESSDAIGELEQVLWERLYPQGESKTGVLTGHLRNGFQSLGAPHAFIELKF